MVDRKQVNVNRLSPAFFGEISPTYSGLNRDRLVDRAESKGVFIQNNVQIVRCYNKNLYYWPSVSCGSTMVSLSSTVGHLAPKEFNILLNLYCINNCMLFPYKNWSYF